MFSQNEPSFNYNQNFEPQMYFENNNQNIEPQMYQPPKKRPVNISDAFNALSLNEKHAGKPEKNYPFESIWPLFLNKYVRTYSFCKFCNDRIFAYKNKFTYNNELECWMIQLPLCKKCATYNIEINTLHNNHFGNKKKVQEDET